MMKKEYQNIIVMFILLIIVAFGYFRIVLYPLEQKIKDMEKKIVEKSQELQRIKVVSERLPFLRQETQFLQSELEDLERRLPKDMNLPELLKIIGKECQFYNIKVSRIDRQSLNTSPKEFNELPFVLNLKTNYHNLGQFLTSIAQQKRIFSSVSLDLRYTAGATDGNYLEGNCILYAYSLK